MEKENMSLDQLDSLKTDLENKLEKLRDELLEVEGEIRSRVMKNKTTEFKELFESHINQYCKFTRYILGLPEVILCKIKEINYDPGRRDWVVGVEYVACHHHDKVIFSNSLDFIYEEQFLSGRVDDIIFYESLDEVKIILKNIIDEQVK